MSYHIKLNRVLVVDVESTCWDQPSGQESEIIEIGWCFLQRQPLKRIQRGSIFVRPRVSSVSEFCTRLTSLTQAHVDQGIPFAEACAQLRKMGARNLTWASYGDYDRKMFEKQCTPGFPDPWRAEYPFGPRHLNVKNLCALIMGWDREVGMDEALKRLGLPLEGRHHRGEDDAWNIADILGELLRRGSCADCPAADLPVLTEKQEADLGLDEE